MQRVKKPGGKSSTPAASRLLSLAAQNTEARARPEPDTAARDGVAAQDPALRTSKPVPGLFPSQDIRRCLSDSRPQQVPSGKSSNGRPRLDGCRVRCWTDAGGQVTGSDAGEPMTVPERIGVGGHSSQRVAVLSLGYNIRYKVGYNIRYSWWQSVGRMCSGQLTGSGAGGPVAGPERRSERLKVGPQSIPRWRTVR